MKNAMQLKAIIKNMAKDKHISAQLVMQNLLLEDREIVTTEDEIEFGGKIIMTNGAKLNVSKPNRKRIRKLLQGLIV